MRVIVAGLVLIFVFLVGMLWLVSSPARVEMEPSVSVVGMETPVRLLISSPHSIRQVRASLEQDGTRHTVYEYSQPARRFWFWGSNPAPAEVKFTAGKRNAPEIKEGKARLIVEATANDFRAQTTTVAREVQVITKPPALRPDGAQHYINQGGSELVTFVPSGYWTEAGVRAGKYSFRSFPIPGKPGERFSLFAFPWDLPASTVPIVFARNPSGAEATSQFWFKVFPKKFRSRELDLSDEFLERVVNQIEPGGSGDLLQRFLRINREMRRENNQTLADLRHKTEERFLWSGPFLQLGNSKVEAQFADSRSYLYKGKKVDEQLHLGFDLSVVKNTPVPASNAGRVIFAEPLGIYGNCIVIDHGYGLQSIYAHLSEIAVKPGEMVARSHVLGKSGATGLAGGDHLHFSMQVDGVQVNAIEWWDAHWIKDRIESKVNLPAPEVSQSASSGK
jgi:murein DD-endopeptidase MepM/ murein hydrolase activator NlpD